MAKNLIFGFLTIFGHAEGVQDFFSKIRLRYLNSIRPTSHHAKFQKNSMSGFGEKIRTDRQTDGQTDKGQFIGPFPAGVQKSTASVGIFSSFKQEEKILPKFW